MEKINDGGPAFPLDFMPVNLPGVPTGMILRDYFAAAAMQGLISQSIGSAIISDCETGAEYAYKMADAMLKAREVQS